MKRMMTVGLVLLSIASGSSNAAKSVTLDNGLVVIAEQMRVSPLVAVSVIYRVGSRNEVVGTTGVSHFVEHMLFNGTEKYPGDMATKEIMKNGGIPSGETYWDFTHFGGVLPSDKIDLILEIEADRMANATVDSASVEEERGVILEELTMYRDVPLLLLIEDLFATAFKVHPYHHWYPGGYIEDIERMDAEHVHRFYKTYYQPANAIVAVVGNISEDEAIEKVRKYFGQIPSEPLPDDDVSKEPEQNGLRRTTVIGDATEGRIMIFFKGPEFATRDWEVGNVMVNLLADGRSALLNQKLVDKGVLSGITMALLPTIDPFGFWLIASTPKDADLLQCEKAIYKEIEDFKKNPPEDNLVEIAKNMIVAGTILQRQTVRERALELASTEALHSWQYADQLIENTKSVTPEEVNKIARKYLDWNKATIAWLIPRENPSDRKLIGSSRNENLIVSLGISAPQAATAATSLKDAYYETLPNGVTIALKEDHTLPIVSIRASLLAGSAYEPEGKAGLARLTAQSVAMGSRKYPYEVLYSKIESFGAKLETITDLERAHLWLSVLSDDSREAIEIVCDLLTSASLQAKDFNRAKREVLSAIDQANEDASQLAIDEFRKVYYHKHPYGRSVIGEYQVVKALKSSEVKSFYESTWTPEGCAIAIVGDFEKERVLELLKEKIGKWNRARKSPIEIPKPAPPSGFSQIVKTMPEKRQVKIIWGMEGVRHTSSDFDAFTIMNFILGGQAFGSRLFDRIREKESMAYMVYSALDLNRKSSAMYIHLGTRPQNVKKAIDALREEIMKIKEGPITDEEIDLAKSFLSSLQPFRMETYGRIAACLLDIVFFGLPVDYYDGFSERIANVTSDQIRQAAQKYLDLENSSLVIVGAVDDDLRPVPYQPKTEKKRRTR
ncbi:MAG: M16 family metallopeptidase [bacterium]